MNNTSEGHPADLISIIKTKDLFDDDSQCQYLDIKNFCELATANKFSVLSQSDPLEGIFFTSVRTSEDLMKSK